MGVLRTVATLGALALGVAPAAAAWAPRPTPAPIVAPIVVLPSCAAPGAAEWRADKAVARRNGVAPSLVVALGRLQAETGVPVADGAAALAGRTGGVSALPARARLALERLLGTDDAERVLALASCVWAGAPAPGLGQEILADRRVDVYVDGRGDLVSGRFDARVPFAIRYLEAAFGSVFVSSIRRGHRVRSTAGAESSHAEGRAFDVGALGNVRIVGHQGRGSVTERAVRLLLMLPRDRRPAQVVSLLDLDGPTGFHGSFAQLDHRDHLHVGF